MITAIPWEPGVQYPVHRRYDRAPARPPVAIACRYVHSRVAERNACEIAAHIGRSRASLKVLSRR